MAWIACAIALDQHGGAGVQGRYDAVVVAGAGGRPGGVPSGTLIRRTRLGADLVLDGVAPVLALTGGVGDWGPAESQVAAELAEAYGVPASQIVLETTSASTEGNARAIREVLGDARVLVVTDAYHAYRCRRVFGRYFAEADAAGVHGPLAPRMWGSVREVATVAWYAIIGRL